MSLPWLSIIENKEETKNSVSFFIINDFGRKEISFESFLLFKPFKLLESKIELLFSILDEKHAFFSNDECIRKDVKGHWLHDIIVVYVHRLLKAELRFKKIQNLSLKNLIQLYKIHRILGGTFLR